MRPVSARRAGHPGPVVFLLVMVLMIVAMTPGLARAGQATLNWNANGESDLGGYYLHYGTQSGNYSQVVNVGNVTTHLLTSLTDGISYYFSVRAYDLSENVSPYSAEVSMVVTDTIPPVLSAIAASVTSGSAQVSWSTDEPATSQVEYGTSTAYGSTTTMDSSLLANHSQMLSGLQSSTLYHFRIWSVDSANNVAISGDNTFTTASGPDTTAPLLSGIGAGTITSTGAVIDWGTDEAATSQVEYGTSTSYGATTGLDPSLVTAHSQPVNGLSPSTTYHFRVISQDAVGNEAMSGDFTLTTATAPDTMAPIISNILASNVTSIAAVISWATDEAATSQVEYGTTTSYGSSTSMDATLTASHSQVLGGLAPSTTYHFRVKSRDGADNLAISSDVTFTTGSDLSTVLITKGAAWRYLDDGTDRGTAWQAPAFDDSGWSVGPAELGYGDGDEATVVNFGPSSTNKHITTYFRKDREILGIHQHQVTAGLNYGPGGKRVTGAFQVPIRKVYLSTAQVVQFDKLGLGL